MGKKVLGIAAVVAVILFFKMRNMGDDDAAIRQEMEAVVESLPCYDAHDEYLDKLLERHHGSAFYEAYEMGGRRRAAEFDENAYVEKLFGGMIKNARDVGKRDLVECLQAARSILLEEE